MIRYLCISLALTTIAFAQEAPPERHTLRWQAPEGREVWYAIDKSRTLYDRGTPAAALGGTKQRIELSLRWLTVGADGKRRLQSRVGHLRRVKTARGQEQVTDSADPNNPQGKMLTRPSTLLLGPGGQATGVESVYGLALAEVPAAHRDLIQVGAIGMVANVHSYLLPLPKEPIAIGGTWKTGMATGVPGVKGQLEVAMTNRLASVTDGVARIVQTGKGLKLTEGIKSITVEATIELRDGVVVKVSRKTTTIASDNLQISRAIETCEVKTIDGPTQRKPAD